MSRIFKPKVYQAPEPKVYQPKYPAPWAFPMAQGYANEVKSMLPRLDNLRSYGGELMRLGRGMTDVGDEQDYLTRVRNYVDTDTGPSSALWNMTQRKVMDALTPRFSGAGILTSGPGISAMREGINDLALQWEEDRRKEIAGNLGLLGGATEQLRGAKESGFTAYNAALEGLKALETLPIALRTQLIASLFSQTPASPVVAGQAAPTLYPSMLQQTMPLLGAALFARGGG